MNINEFLSNYFGALLGAASGGVACYVALRVSIADLLARVNNLEKDSDRLMSSVDRLWQRTKT